LSRFKGKETRWLKKSDTLIICGDFGFVWGGSPKEKRILKWIGKRRYNVLFVEGIHENLDLLSAYPEAEWNGGKVRELGGKLRMLKRGEIFVIEDKKIFAFGGGETEDNSDCSGGELPALTEIENARINLEKNNYQVDYIITHRPSRRIRNFLLMDQNDANVLDAFLDEVREKCSYRRWFFGEIHMNKRIPPSEMALFKAVVDAAGEL